MARPVVPADFERALSDEILESELIRMRVLAGTVAVLLVGVEILLFAFHDLAQSLARRPISLWLPPKLLAPFLVYQCIAIVVLTRRRRRGAGVFAPLRFLNVIVEASLPSVLLWRISQDWDPAAGIVAGLVAVRLRRKFERAVEEGAARERVTNLFGQHVSPSVVERLLDRPEELAGETREICVMFLDIRNFTAAARERRPAEVVEYLNGTFAFMIEAVDRHGGFINKFSATGSWPCSGRRSTTRAPWSTRSRRRATSSPRSAGAGSPTARGRSASAARTRARP